MTEPAAARVPVAPILLLLFATGWAANHFAALLPVLQRDEGLSAGLLAGAYGIYAIGLLPGLLLGGSLSDRIGRRRLALPGATLVLVGTLTLLLWHDAAGLLTGRLIVGLGAGATFGAGTAWATDRRGSAGATRAGIALTAGFATGPVVTGLLAQWAPAPIAVTFGLSAVLSLSAVLAASRLSPIGSGPIASVAADPADLRDISAPRSAGRALGWALPIAPWVFAGAAVGVVTLPSRLDQALRGPLLAGLAAGIVLGVGILVQILARRLRAGPGAGVVGAASAAAGMITAALGGGSPSVALVVAAAVLLGTGYGLCLRAGLLDLAAYSPPARRGTMTGIFYLATYLGFAVPILLEVLRPVSGPAAPLYALAALAASAALQRWWRLARRPAPS